ncbi:MAG: hypothetical protein K2Y35_02280 [Burkholderiales bacterium]|nr:hypothetical protein [Burkholderiales bacterium]
MPMSFRSWPRTIVMLCAGFMATHGAWAADDALWEQIKEGGYVLLIRHAATPLTKAPTPTSRGGCVHERDLSDAGQMLARKLGVVFREHGVPVARVVSSPGCPSVETAQIAFGRAEPWTDLDPAVDRHTRLSRSVNALVNGTAQTGNLVVVTDKLAISDLTDRTLSAGDVLVLKRSGEQLDIQGLLTAAP